MIRKDWIAFYNIKSKLKLFQVLEIFFILQIKIKIRSNDIFINKMEYKKIRFLYFYIYIINLLNFTIFNKIYL